MPGLSGITVASLCDRHYDDHIVETEGERGLIQFIVTNPFPFTDKMLLGMIEDYFAGSMLSCRDALYSWFDAVLYDEHEPEIVFCLKQAYDIVSDWVDEILSDKRADTNLNNRTVSYAYILPEKHISRVLYVVEGE